MLRSPSGSTLSENLPGAPSYLPSGSASMHGAESLRSAASTSRLGWDAHHSLGESIQDHGRISITDRLEPAAQYGGDRLNSWLEDLPDPRPPPHDSRPGVHVETTQEPKLPSYPAAVHGSKKRMFGIQQPRKTQRQTNNPFDYDKKYEEDEWGQEWAPNARVWRVYLDEAQIYDLELTEGWKDTLDVFLVFVGLFSAIEATFLAVSVTAIQPDYGQATATLLMEQIALYRAVSAGLSPDIVPPSTVDAFSPASPSSNDLWVNGLWFSSLALSLCSALVAVLIKQWIQQYLKFVSGTSTEQIRSRQFKYAGLEQWGVPVIIGLLPLTLHLSLFLYLAGLTVFLIPLNQPLGIVVGAITGITFVAYMISNLLPILYLDCPYKTPIPVYAYDLLISPILYLPSLFRLYIAKARSHLNDIRWHRRWPFVFLPSHSTWGTSALYHEIQPRKTFRDREASIIKELAHKLEMTAIAWLCSVSSNPTVSSIASESISALPVEVSDNEAEALLAGVSLRVQDLLASQFDPGSSERGELKAGSSLILAERLGRASMRLPLVSPHIIRIYSSFPHEPQEYEQTDAAIPELSAIGNYAELYTRLHEFSTNEKQVMVDQIIHHAHPSIWVAYSRLLRDQLVLSTYLNENDQINQSFEALFALIPTHIHDYQRLSQDREGYVKLSLIIRHLTSYCPYDYNMDYLQWLTRKFDELDKADRCNKQLHDLTMSMFCLVLLTAIGIISPTSIQELFRTNNHFYGVIEWIQRDARIFDTLALRFETRESHNPATVLRQICHRAVPHLHFNDISGSWLALRLLHTSFYHSEHMFLEEDFNLTMMVMKTIARDATSSISTQELEALSTMTRCLAIFMEERLNALPFSSPLATPTDQLFFAMYQDANAVLALLYPLHGHTTLRMVPKAVTESRKEVLASYLRQLYRLVTIQPGFSTACFQALDTLLLIEEIRYSESAEHCTYLNAFMEKLKDADPTWAGLERVNKDGTPKLVIYQCKRVRDNIHLGGPELEMKQQRKGEHLVTLSGGQEFIAIPMKNNFAHVLNDPTTAHAEHRLGFAKPQLRTIIDAIRTRRKKPDADSEEEA